MSYRAALASHLHALHAHRGSAGGGGAGANASSDSAGSAGSGAASDGGPLQHRLDLLAVEHAVLVGVAQREHVVGVGGVDVGGAKASLFEVGYTRVGIDEGWENCSGTDPDHGLRQHNADGTPMTPREADGLPATSVEAAARPVGAGAGAHAVRGEDEELGARRSRVPLAQQEAALLPKLPAEGSEHFTCFRGGTGEAMGLKTTSDAMRAQMRLFVGSRCGQEVGWDAVKGEALTKLGWGGGSTYIENSKKNLEMTGKGFFCRNAIDAYQRTFCFFIWQIFLICCMFLFFSHFFVNRLACIESLSLIL